MGRAGREPVGDKLFGQWNVLSWYRAAAVFFFALGTMRLWDFASRRDARLRN